MITHGTRIGKQTDAMFMGDTRCMAGQAVMGWGGAGT